MSGRRHAGDFAVLLAEHRLDPLGAEAPQTNLNQCPDQSAAHLVEEPVAADDKGEVAASALDAATVDGADGVFHPLGMNAGEGAEILPTLQIRRRFAHRLQIELARDVPDAVLEERVHPRVVPELVAVFLGGGVVLGMEILRAALNPLDTDILGQMGVQCQDEFARRNAKFFFGDIRMGDQCQSMDAGIGTAATVDSERAGKELAERLLDALLDGQP